MITCPNCQFDNPGVHKFCQRCGEPLPLKENSRDLDQGQLSDSQPSERQTVSESQRASASAKSSLPLRARLMPPDKRALAPEIYLDSEERYQVVTVLSQGSAVVVARTSEGRSPLQSQLDQLMNASASTLQAIENLPAAAYPYLLLSSAAPKLYDAVQQGETAILIELEQPTTAPLLKALSEAVDPLQYVYWMYNLTDLWRALAPIPQWRSSLIQADNLGIDPDQSLRVRYFVEPSIQPPTLSALKGFLQSLLAQPHRGNVPLLRQIRRIIVAVTSATTVEGLSQELAEMGQALLDVPEAMTPSVSAAGRTADKVSAEEWVANSVESVENADDVPDDGTGSMEIDSEDSSSNLNALSLNASNPSTANTMENITRDRADDELTMALPADDELTMVLPAEDELSEDATTLLPMRLNGLTEAGRTDVGKQRDHNEDCFLIASSQHKRADNNGQYTRAHGLYVLCDGMGGHAGGEVASALAAQTLSAYFDEHWPAPSGAELDSPLPAESVMVEAVKLANQAIYEVNEKEGRAGHERMGTTLVLVLLQGTEAAVAHVGDSRLYQYSRRMGVQQVTVDHEVGQREMQRGIPEALAYARPDAYQLTQALGPRDSADLRPSVAYLRFIEDTLLLLCSDGLSDNDVVEDYLESHIAPLLTEKKALSSGLNELVDLANEVNGHDNISAIALQIKVSPDMSEVKNTRDSGQTILQ